MSQQTEIYKAIELLLLWEGRFTTKELAELLLKKSRQTMQAPIKKFVETYPEIISYNASQHCYEINAEFDSQYSDGELKSYLNLIKNKNAHFVDLVDIFSPKRNLCADVFRKINIACRKQLAVKIQYGSMSSEKQERIIEPHNVVSDGLRWHVRAYCQKRQRYLDFVLSRIYQCELIEEIHRDSFHDEEQDENWQTKVEIILIPDPRLDDNQKENIAQDYQMENGQLIIETRAALVQYVLKRLRVDIMQAEGVAQQVIIEPKCMSTLKQYLPK